MPRNFETNGHNSEPKNSEKKLTLRGGTQTNLGKTISYVQNLGYAEAKAAETITSRYLPYALDLNDPTCRALAIQCAEQCLAWGRAIYRYMGWPGPDTASVDVSPVNHHGHLPQYSIPEKALANVSNDVEPQEDELEPINPGVEKMKKMGILD